MDCKAAKLLRKEEEERSWLVFFSFVGFKYAITTDNRVAREGTSTLERVQEQFGERHAPVGIDFERVGQQPALVGRER